MRIYSIPLAFLSALLLQPYPAVAEQSQNTSAYTDIGSCQPLRIFQKDTSFEKQSLCPAPNGYAVKYGHHASIQDYNKDDITILSPNHQRYDLWPKDAYTVILQSDRLEWRLSPLIKDRPIAFIYRASIWNENANGESFLIISKITENTVCIVAKIPAGMNDNLLARAIADKAETLPCLE